MTTNNDTISVTKARENLADVLGEVRFGHKRIKLTSNGKNVGAIVPLEDLELLEALEDRIDIELAHQALQEDGSTSFDEVLTNFNISRDTILKSSVKSTKVKNVRAKIQA